MTSINTNSSAMFALQTLRSVNKEIDNTNNRISTGLKINSAADGAAYWSISSTLKSDNGALGAVKDAMTLDKNSVDAAYGGLTNVLSALDNIKSKLTAATSANTDRVKLQKEISSFLDQIKTTASNTVMNGDNWLSTDTGATDFNAVKGIVSSFSRNGSSVSVETQDLDTGAFILYDASGTTGTANTTTVTALTAVGSAASATVTGGDEKGFMDTVYAFTISGAAVTTSLEDLDISGLNDSQASLDTLQTYIKLVDATIQQLQNGATDLGAASSQVGSNRDFVQKLIDINKSSIGALIDTDLEEESTRLKALQTQQQLGVQSLSIANSASGNVLSLFRS
jgi:flagellin